LLGREGMREGMRGGLADRKGYWCSATNERGGDGCWRGQRKERKREMGWKRRS
jgi:hypothetical protein